MNFRKVRGWQEFGFTDFYYDYVIYVTKNT